MSEIEYDEYGYSLTRPNFTIANLIINSTIAYIDEWDYLYKQYKELEYWLGRQALYDPERV